MAALSAGVPVVPVYLTSALVSLALAARTASIGVLMRGSPVPRWMTLAPDARRRWASSLSLSVADGWMARASWLMRLV